MANAQSGEDTGSPGPTGLFAVVAMWLLIGLVAWLLSTTTVKAQEGWGYEDDPRPTHPAPGWPNNPRGLQDGLYGIQLQQPEYMYRAGYTYTDYGYGYDQWGNYRYGLVTYTQPGRYYWTGRSTWAVEVWRRYTTRQGLLGWSRVCGNCRMNVLNPGRPLVWTDEMINNGTNLR